MKRLVRPATIRMRVALSVILVHAIMMTAFIVDISLREKAFLEQEARSRAFGLSRMTAVNSTSWILSEDVQGLSEIVQSLRSYPDVLYAMILDRDLRVLGHTDPSKIDKRLGDEISRSLLHPDVSETLLYDNDSIIDVAVPVIFGSNFIGWSRIALDMRHQDMQIRSIIINGVLYIILATMVGVAFAFWIARRLTAELHHLGQEANQLRQGNRQLNRLRQPTVEVSVLEKSFIEMANTIWKREDELAHERDTLDQRVRERTIALASEVAERREAEKRLRQSEAQLQTIFAAAPLPMQVSRLSDHSILFINPEAERLLKTLPVGRTAGGIDCYGPPDRKQQLFQRLHETGAFLGEIVQISAPHEPPLWLMVSAVALRYGEEQAILTCMSDISATKAAEQAILDAKLRSDAALMARDETLREQRNFLSMISHEFRTPLGIIAGAASMLSEYECTPQETRAEANRIHAAVLRLCRMVDDLVAHDWLETSTHGLRWKDLDLVPLLSEVVTEFRDTEPTRPIQLTAPVSMPLRGEGHMIRVAVANLLGNACKYSAKNTMVQISLNFDADWADITVRDWGMGIRADDVDRIFEKFYRANAAERTPGTGVGLYLVRQIATLHGGSVSASNADEGGAVFTLRLPRSDVLNGF